MRRLVMRRLGVSTAAVVLVLSAIVGGLVGPVAAANGNACFGQDRAAYATTNAPGSVGDAASSRKGDNAAINAAYRDGCQP